MNEDIQLNNRRKFLVNTGKMAVATATVLGTANMASARTTDHQPIHSIKAGHYYIDNVLVETGFEYDQDGEISATQTDLVTLEINGDKIVSVHKNRIHNVPLPAYSANGQLLLPAFRDMHIHLDKTFYGGQWVAPPSNKNKSVHSMIAYEHEILPKLQPYTQERAEAIKNLIQSYGSTIARSHCNVEQVSQLKNLENLQAMLDRNKDNFTCEIVAFPQHGLLLSNSEGLMREAMAMGADYVGGLDPASVDKDMKKSLDTMFQIALDYNKGVDIHLHETAPSGMQTINYMIDFVEKNPELKDKLTISHAFALSTISPEEAKDVAQRMAAQGVTIASTVPIGPMHMPLSILRDEGVFIITGTDSVIDWWSPYGFGDMLEKANLYAQLYSYSDEYGLSRALEIATGNKLPLNNKGEQVWPKAGDDASFVLVNASCSAEAVARISPRTAAFHKGNLASGHVARS